MPECESCGASFSNLTKCEFCGAVIANTEKPTVIEQKVTVQLIDTESAKNAVNKVSDNVKKANNAIKPWLILIGGVLMFIFGLIILFSDKNKSISTWRVILVIGGGICLISSAVSIFKKQ
ncbi:MULTISPECIES: hypothetical protein [unclassified Dysgonomonas]|uniref:hypothetical protein n=1 Tax=unclassified Dysgonomonas TaxID=2630389 RepID=UPI002472E9E1|nr:MULTISPECIES: hypothetical protein [unclassified Dysgonomonas]